MNLEKLENMYFAYHQVFNTFLLLEMVYEPNTINYEDLRNVYKTLPLKEAYLSLSFIIEYICLDRIHS